MPQTTRSQGDGQRTTRTLSRGLQLLQLVAEAPGGLSLSVISRAAGLDKATTSRLLATLRSEGWIRVTPTDRHYRLTGKLAHLARFYDEAAAFDLPDLARPYLTALRDRVNETIHLGVIRGDRIVYVDKIESTNSIRLVSAVGQTMPILTTALGRAMLATLSEQERAVRVEELELPRRTATSTTDKAVLLEELEACARRGYSTDPEQNEEGVSCAGAAIRGPDGAAIAAISVSGPTYRMTAKLDEIGELCVDVAREISRELGMTRWRSGGSPAGDSASPLLSDEDPAHAEAGRSREWPA